MNFSEEKLHILISDNSLYCFIVIMVVLLMILYTQ